MNIVALLLLGCIGTLGNTLVGSNKSQVQVLELAHYLEDSEAVGAFSSSNNARVAVHGDLVGDRESAVVALDKVPCSTDHIESIRIRIFEKSCGIAATDVFDYNANAGRREISPQAFEIFREVCVEIQFCSRGREGELVLDDTIRTRIMRRAVK